MNCSCYNKNDSKEIGMKHSSTISYHGNGLGNDANHFLFCVDTLVSFNEFNKIMNVFIHNF